MNRFVYRVFVIGFTLLSLSLPSSAGSGIISGTDRHPALSRLIPELSSLPPGIQNRVSRFLQRSIPPGLNLESIGRLPAEIRLSDQRQRSRTIEGVSAQPTTILTESWNAGGSVWENSAKTDMTYDGSDRLIETVNSIWSGSAWEPSERNTETYDGSGNLTQELTEVWLVSAWEPSARTTNTYNGAGQVLTTLIETWNGSSWDELFRITSTYDGSGNRIEFVAEVNFGVWMNFARILSTFDGSNRPTNLVVQTWTGGAWTDDGQFVLTWDGSNRLITQLEQDWSGSAWVDLTKNSFTYDGSGKQTERLVQTWTGSWVNESRVATTYDGGGNATEVLNQTWNGSAWDNVDHTNSTYSGGDPVEDIDQVWIGGAWLNAERRTYTYGGATAVDEAGQPVGDFRLADNYPNPFNPSTEIGYTIKVQSIVRLTIQDLLGREVATLVNGVVPPGSYTARWSAENLPAGVYFYRIETDGFSETKKMILLK